MKNALSYSRCIVRTPKLLFTRLKCRCACRIKAFSYARGRMKRITGTTWLMVLIVVALVIRLYQIDSISNRFHRIRQYNTAMMTRGYFVQLSPLVPQWQREIALAVQPPMLEPPIIQGIALAGYLLIGHEALGIPRVFSAIIWCLAAYPLFKLAKRLMRPDAALVTVALYLFLPFGILASRAFQINPAMVAAIIFSWDVLVRCFEQPTRRNWLIATFWTGLANILLIYAAAFIYPLVLVWLWRKRQSPFNRDILLFGFGSLLPSVLYYADGYWGSGFLRTQGGTLFQPELLVTLGFWANWVWLMTSILGPVLLVLTLQGLLTVRSAPASWIIRSLWFSYFLFGLAFAWPISSHNYYSLPLIPIVALTIGAMVSFLLSFPAIRQNVRASRFIPAICILIIMTYGVLVYLPQTTVTLEEQANFESAFIIGNKLNHTYDTISLTDDYGSFLTFYGYLPTINWPNRWDRNLLHVQGKPIPDPQAIMERLNPDASYRYFVVTSFMELQLQPDLQVYLTDHFPVLERTDYYIIYDLQGGV